MFFLSLRQGWLFIDRELWAGFEIGGRANASTITDCYFTHAITAFRAHWIR